MGQNYKNMISIRVSKVLRDRTDFIVRNTNPDDVKDRSAAVRLALEAWLPGQEERLRELGLLPKKAR